MQSLELIPEWMATAWGVDVAVTQVILSSFIFLCFVLPPMVLHFRVGNSGFGTEIVLGFFAECLCVGLGWLNIWVMIVTVLLVAIGTATLGKDKLWG